MLQAWLLRGFLSDIYQRALHRREKWFHLTRFKNDSLIFIRFVGHHAVLSE
jgi:hypothetical protein